jgi:DNA-directed RNA polymerase specialized sigma24 family protein
VGQPCREILDLRYFGDLSYDEISLALQMNPKTVSSRLSKVPRPTRDHCAENI